MDGPLDKGLDEMISDFNRLHPEGQVHSVHMAPTTSWCRSSWVPFRRIHRRSLLKCMNPGQINPHLLERGHGRNDETREKSTVGTERCSHPAVVELR